MTKYFILLLTFIFINNAFTQGENDVRNLVANLLGETQIEEDLQELCDKIGGRVPGTAANEKAVEWGLQKFRSAGVNTDLDSFTMPVKWIPRETNAELTGDLNYFPRLVSKYKSPSGRFTSEMVYVGMGTDTDFANLKTSVKDKIVLVESDLCLDIAGLFAEYAAATQAEINARKAGVKAVVFMSSRPRGLLYRFLTMEGTDNELPQFVMAREDAQRCIRVLKDGGNVNINIYNQAEVGEAFTAHNVIAEIRGSERPDEVVIIGAHIDSWALGTGANDNGCNVSMMIDIARQMKRLNIKPKRTIRFALWNGEEQGYFGSWDYTKDHENELDKHIMALSVDIGSGAINGFFTNGQKELIPAVNNALRPVAGLGEFNQLNIPIVGTDNFDFMLQGVGNLVASHKPQVYGVNYHASSDTYDKVDLKQLKVNSAIVGALTLGFANMRPEMVKWKRQSRAEVEQLMKDFDLEFTLRMFNVWEPWANGKRGIKK